jgi:DNA-binding NarL/FixJ family response regulator
MGILCGAALVVDDDDVSRELIVGLLNSARFDCISAKRGDEALIASRESRPWLVISEVGLPDLSGYELCRQLRDAFGEEVAIVFLSADRTEPLDRVAGLLVGADDYIAKPFDPSELLARVRRLAQRLGATEARLAEAPAPGQQLTKALTSRERETLILLASGRRQREIAADLSIQEKTVATHLQRVLEKLDVHSRAQAVAIAYQDGLVTSADVALRAV